MALLIERTFFRDQVNELYSVYDSDLPPDFYTRMGDSDSAFEAIDYLSLRDSEGDQRTFKILLTDRKKELLFLNEQDFQLAMRLDGSLTWTEGDETYTDFDAYERKWNQINTLREDSEGWRVSGFGSAFQHHQPDRRYFRQTNGETDEPIYSKVKTPLNAVAFENEGVWFRTYVPELNRSIFDRVVYDSDLRDVIDGTSEYVNFYDPEINRKSRR